MQNDLNFFVFVRLESVDEFLEWTKDVTKEPSNELKHKVRICFPKFPGFTMVGVGEDLWKTIRRVFENSSKCS